jgi:hypothetical protein
VFLLNLLAIFEGTIYIYIYIMAIYIHAPDHRSWCNGTNPSDDVYNIQSYIERIFRYGSLAVVMFLVFSSYYCVSPETIL